MRKGTLGSATWWRGRSAAEASGSYGPISVPWSYDVSITAVDGYDATTIDGGAGPAVVVQDGALVLRGFTITGTGTDDGFYPDGGALSVKEGTATVHECRVTGTRFLLRHHPRSRPSGLLPCGARSPRAPKRDKS
jgi:hypothetical protein